MTNLASAPHRFNLNDLAPHPGKGLKASEAMRQVEGQGVDQVGADDLELYKLLLSPAEYKRFLHRLDKAVADHWRNLNRSQWTETELPFSTDMNVQIKGDRLRAEWVARADGEPFPPSWTVTTEYLIPGRLRLIVGREFSARSLRGRLRFRHAVTTDGGDVWVDGWDTAGRCHSISIDRVRVVHAKSKVHPKLRDRLS